MGQRSEEKTIKPVEREVVCLGNDVATASERQLNMIVSRREKRVGTRELMAR